MGGEAGPGWPLALSVEEAALQAASLEDALRAALARICRHTGWLAGRVELGSNGSGADPRVVWHLEQPEALAVFRELAEARRRGRGGGLAAQVLHDAAPHRALTPSEEKISCFAFPALRGGSAVAALEFFSRELLPPAPELLDSVARACAVLGEVIPRKYVEEALLRAEDHLELFESAADALMVLDEAGRLLDLNLRACEVLGAPRARLLGTQLPLPADLPNRHFRTALHLRDGSGEAALELSASRVRWHGRTATLVFARELATPKTRVALPASAEAAGAPDARYRLLFESSPIPMWVHEEKTRRFLAVNEAALRHYGYSRERFLAMTVDELVPEAAGSAMVADQRTGASMQRHRSARGELRDVEISAHRIDFAGKPARLVTATDVTARRKAQSRLLRAAFYDPLTGLANRALFSDRLGIAFARADSQPGQGFAVLFLDLDRFKVVNDSLGHRAGDELLAQIARRLESCGRAGDTVARMGGDEFVLLAENVAGEEAAERVAERVHRALAPPFVIEGHELFASASIGVALHRSGMPRPEQLLRDADAAMYRAKTLPSRIALFQPSMREAASSSLERETDLRHAIERDELRLRYQPIVDLDSRRVLGFETLVRWQHPQRGLTLPGDFIPLAEETGLIVPLGAWVLEHALNELASLPAPLTLSINLSARQLLKPDLPELVASLLARSGLTPERLCLELTETVLIDSGAAAAACLHRLRALGVKLCLDDFGTGYSSLSYLHELPMDEIKIDASFVHAMGADPRKIGIIQSILLLGRSLGLTVVAEGVETADQAAALRRLGCERAQGYHFAAPLTRADALAMVELGRAPLPPAA